MVLPALIGGDYEFRSQARLGSRLGGGRHVVDAIATADDGDILISLKWQQVSGTAEEKVPFEVMCLAQALREGPYVRAYLVLGGDGWKRRTFFTSGALGDHLRHADKVHVVTLERFVALANRREL